MTSKINPARVGQEDFVVLVVMNGRVALFQAEVRKADPSRAEKTFSQPVSQLRSSSSVLHSAPGLARVCEDPVRRYAAPVKFPHLPGACAPGSHRSRRCAA